MQLWHFSDFQDLTQRSTGIIYSQIFLHKCDFMIVTLLKEIDPVAAEKHEFECRDKSTFFLDS